MNIDDAVLKRRAELLARDQGVAFPPEPDLAIAIAYRQAELQMERTPEGVIGERKTPVKSVWPMRPKWEKFGRWWSYIGRDGDVRFEPGVGPVVPRVLQLFYVKLDDGNVEQLAWERPDLWEKWKFGDEPTISIVSEKTQIHYNG